MLPSAVAKFREVRAQITRNPEFYPGEFGQPVVTFVDLVSVVELTVVFGFAVLVVCRRVRIEITHTEVWTTARLDGGGIDCPVSGRSPVSGGKTERGNER